MSASLALHLISIGAASITHLAFQLDLLASECVHGFTLPLGLYIDACRLAQIPRWCYEVQLLMIKQSSPQPQGKSVY